MSNFHPNPFPYTIYELDDIAIPTSLNDKHTGYIMPFELGILRCALSVLPIFCDHSEIYEKPHFVGHLCFYAMCEGWGKFTETGYKSHYFFHGDPAQYLSHDFVSESFLRLLESHNFTVPVEIQQTLF